MLGVMLSNTSLSFLISSFLELHEVSAPSIGKPLQQQKLNQSAKVRSLNFFLNMGKVFFTKKQKAQMRERRKKKRLSSKKNTSENALLSTKDTEIEPPLDQEGKDEVSDSILKTATTKKRPREEDSVSGPVQKKISLELTMKLVQGKLHVMIPSSLSTKAAKKFRKDARRQLRLEGKKEDIEFVASSAMPKPKKKQFPSIRELLQQKHQLEEINKQEEKRRQKIQQIPDEIRKLYVALDCEMVGIGSDGKKSALARVSIVDWDLNVVLDSFVKVPIRVTDFRTHVSGVEPKHIKNSTAMDVSKCRELVASILKEKVLVGHALTNDLKALLLTHPKNRIRDTAKYRPFQRFGNGKWRARKLRDLVKENLKDKEGFQEGEHDSVQDAKATMELFQLVQSQWEKEVASKKKK